METIITVAVIMLLIVAGVMLIDLLNARHASRRSPAAKPCGDPDGGPARAHTADRPH
ncbi:hypothetical protein AB0G35_03570 [Streptomyces sp. NPDC021749]|uniref:hypothetical protein n=1 Tax=Streptomyces sp. NPDC021749 TaxID=3154905 RepID=UPI0034112A6E